MVQGLFEFWGTASDTLFLCRTQFNLPIHDSIRQSIIFEELLVTELESVGNLRLNDVVVIVPEPVAAEAFVGLPASSIIRASLQLAFSHEKAFWSSSRPKNQPLLCKWPYLHCDSSH